MKLTEKSGENPGGFFPDAGRCARCGACVPVCPVFRATGHEACSARGRLHLLQKIPQAEWSSRLGDIVSRCLLCGACSAACPRGIDIVPLVQEARHRFPPALLPRSFVAGIGKKILAHRLSLILAGKISRALPFCWRGSIPKSSGLRLRLAACSTPPLLRPQSSSGQKKTVAVADASVLFFAGCLASHLETEISDAVLELAGAAGEKTAIPVKQGCCGMAQAAAGDLDRARSLARANIQAFAGSTLPILCSCASCFHQLTRYPLLLAGDPAWREQALAFAARLREFSTFFLPRLEKKDVFRPRGGRPPLCTFWHDPCHLRFPHKIVAEPRLLLALAPGLALAETGGASGCCGQGGFFSVNHPETAEKIRRGLFASLAGMNADRATSTCTGCLLQLRHGLKTEGSDLPVRHLAVLLAQNLAPPQEGWTARGNWG